MGTAHIHSILKAKSLEYLHTKRIPEFEKVLSYARECIGVTLLYIACCVLCTDYYTCIG